MLELSATGKEFGPLGFDGVENCMQVSFALDWKDSWWRSDIWERCCAVLEMSFDDSQDKAEPATDTDDVLLAVNGDHDAFGRIIDKYQRTITDQMRRFSRQPAVLEELVHDVFVEAFTSLHTYRSHAPFLHWLRKIAVRRGYRFWKTNAREKSTVSLIEIRDRLDNLTSGDTSSETGAGDVLGDLLDRLSPRDRLVLTLLYWDDCSVAEAANLAGWTQVMVKVQAHRARKRLKKLIEETQK